MVEVSPANSASFSEIKQGAEDGSLLVIDVRSPSELAGGKINSKRWINIPIAEFEQAFGLSDEDFKDKYGQSKPAADGSDLIVNCGSGRRSEKALEILLRKKYFKARHYPGGYGRWKAEEAQQK